MRKESVHPKVHISVDIALDWHYVGQKVIQCWSKWHINPPVCWPKSPPPPIIQPRFGVERRGVWTWTDTQIYRYMHGSDSSSRIIIYKVLPYYSLIICQLIMLHIIWVIYMAVPKHPEGLGFILLLILLLIHLHFTENVGQLYLRRKLPSWHGHTCGSSVF